MLGAGRTAAETAELLGVHRATLYRALRGQEISQAEAAADALAAARRTRRHDCEHRESKLLF
jgi:IS30 family transposase